MAIDSAIRNIIKNNGYITVDEMMSEIISANPLSYYRTAKNIGSKGDFITSPEISQLFGEVIGLWIIDQWQKIGSPSKFTLLELGPGTGTMMRDVLRSIKLVPQIKEAAHIHMYDVNPHFIEQQKEKLAPLHSNIRWIKNLHELPKQPLIVISNEFFDALPIKQFKKIKHTWYESILVTSPEDGRIKFNQLEVNSKLQKQLKQEHPNATDGAVVEESVASYKIIKMLAELINEHTGSLLAIDYGYDMPKSDRMPTQYNSTLQAIMNHEYQPIIETLGEADLSAHVDFQALMMAAGTAGIKYGSITSQEQFLKAFGIMIRLQQLQRQNDTVTSEILGKQVYRLTSPKQMGNLFKVLQFWKCPN